jgi:pantoate--beta-alanine ligase
MKLFTTKKGLDEELQNWRNAGKSIGFVPTMGALHKGHISLVENSKANNQLTVASIFVNPTQFNDPNDLRNYPRTLEKDCELLERIGCDIVFVPSDSEMYPEPDTRVFDFGQLDQVMEGRFRKGHFNGVAQIVSKLFDAVKPHRAYFGLKDFQQYVIIKHLVQQSHIPIEIVACPIIRESDGLAMSSRNVRLTPEQRINASEISKSLFKAKELQREKTIDQVKKWVMEEVNKNPFLDVEYFEIVNDTMLQPVSDWENDFTKVGCIAVMVGKIRLIDNVIFD